MFEDAEVCPFTAAALSKSVANLPSQCLIDRLQALEDVLPSVILEQILPLSDAVTLNKFKELLAS